MSVYIERLPAKLPPQLRGSTPLFSVTLWETIDPAPPGFEPKPLDLTNAVVHMTLSATPDEAQAPEFDATLTTDAEPRSGKASVRLTTGQTNRNGTWYVEFRVHYTAGVRSGQVLWAGSSQILFKEGLS